MTLLASYLLALLSVASTAAAATMEPREAILLEALELQSRQTAPPVGPDAQLIVNAINDIGLKLAAANDSVVAYTSGGIDGIKGLISINGAVVDLGDSIEAATNTVQASPVLPAQDS